MATCKTKGKVRVVTAQSRYVKDVLGNVHDALYDSITSRRWCLRGEYNVENARQLVEDRRDGEEFYSADFSSATDGFHLKMVAAVAGLLTENPYLTDEEREAIRASFPEDFIVVREGSCLFAERHEVLRGQMMGSKLSFPLLCLVNRGMFLIATQMWGNAVGVRGRRRRVRINGDDIAFCTDRIFSVIWESVVSHFGMVLNLEKSMKSKRYVELNSKIFDAKTDRFVRKPILSCFRRVRTPGCVLSSLIEGLQGFKPAVVWGAIVAVRNLVLRSGVCVSTIPRPWFRRLVKHWWFRQAAAQQPVVEKLGVDRSVPIVLSGVAPAEEEWGKYRELCMELTRANTTFWTGKKTEPYEEILGKPKATYSPGVLDSGDECYVLNPLVRGAHLPRVSHVQMSVSKREWRWAWPRPVLEVWEGSRFPLVSCRGFGTWATDHEHLQVKRRLVIINRGFPPTLELTSYSNTRVEGAFRTFWKRVERGV